MVHEDRRALLVPMVLKATWGPLGQQLFVYKLYTTDTTLMTPTNRWRASMRPPARRPGCGRSLPASSESSTWPGAPMAVAWRSRARMARAATSGSGTRRTGQGERVLTGHKEQV